MRTHRSNPRALRRRPLVACLAIAYSAEIFAGPNAAHSVAKKRSPDHPDAAQTWTVMNCDDAGTDSLRDIIENPNKAQSGDTVDLSQLPTLCGAANSTITLASGEITIAQNDLTVRGPNAEGPVTISGGGASRVFKHLGVGTLAIDALTIADGYYHAAGSASGGCIASAGSSVVLNRVKVTGCTALSDTAYARGGGIFALHAVTLVLSSVSGNDAIAPMKRGFGGGIYADTLSAKYSSIAANEAHDGSNLLGGGGGAYTLAGVSMLASTIDDNTASYGGGLVVGGPTYISNSTISENVAHKSIAALFGNGINSLAILNSTIAFNHAEADTPYGAVTFLGPVNSTLTLQSSIIAGNTAGATNTWADLFVAPAHGALSGADNLVMASNVSPPSVITVSADPKLGPLQFNGGWTLTHAPLSGSPALGVGNNSGMSPTDQRGPGYPRTTGIGGSITTDIGAIQFDTIFFGGFEFSN